MRAGENGLKLPCKQHSPSATPTSVIVILYLLLCSSSSICSNMCIPTTGEQHGFELCGFIYTQSFFNKHLNSFQSKVGRARTRRLTLYCPFYMGDLSIHRFSYPQGFLEPIPMDTEGQTKFLEN